MSITKAQTALCVSLSIAAATLTAELIIPNAEGQGPRSQLVLNEVTRYLYSLAIAGTLRFINDRFTSASDLQDRIGCFLTSSAIGAAASLALFYFTGPIKSLGCLSTEEVAEKGLEAFRAFCGCVTADKSGKKFVCMGRSPSDFWAVVQSVGHSTLGGLQALCYWRNAQQQRQLPSEEQASPAEQVELLRLEEAS